MLLWAPAASADQSTSFQLLPTFPNEASTNTATSTSFGLNDAGITWHEYPGTSTSFQLLHPTANLTAASTSTTTTTTGGGGNVPSGGGGGGGGRGGAGRAPAAGIGRGTTVAPRAAPQGMSKTITPKTTAPLKGAAPVTGSKTTTPAKPGTAKNAPAGTPQSPTTGIPEKNSPAKKSKDTSQEKVRSPQLQKRISDRLQIRKRIQSAFNDVLFAPAPLVFPFFQTFLNEWNQIPGSDSGTLHQAPLAAVSRFGRLTSSPLLPGNGMVELMWLLSLIAAICGTSALRMHMREERIQKKNVKRGRQSSRRRRVK